VTKFLAFFDELEKLAFGPEAMGKVFNRFKQLQIKSPHFNSYMAGEGGASGLKKALGPARAAGVPERMIEESMPAAREVMSHMRPSGKTTFAPVRGDSATFFRNAGAVDDGDAAFAAIQKSPGNRKALDAVIKGHELAETQVRPEFSFQGVGHRSPDVILREHNMIRTLPAENKAVGDYMTGLRAAGEAPALESTTGFRYGEGPRISRHARRRLVDIHEKEYLKQVREAGMLPTE
jgi:hypothetical protein